MSVTTEASAGQLALQHDQADAAPALPQLPRKRKRVKTGCLTCRARKVKCDETHPLCNNCRNLHVQCQWSEAPQRRQSTPPSNQPPGPLNAPANTSSTKSCARSPACFTCRYARSKCSKTRPACARCVIYNHDCKYPESKGARSLSSSAQSWMRKFQTRDADSPAQGYNEGPEDSGINIAGPNQSNFSPPSTVHPEQSQPPPDTAYGDFPTHRAIYNNSPPRTFDRSNELITPNSPVRSCAPTSQAHSAVGSGTNVPSIPFTSRLPSQEKIERLAVAFFRRVHVYRANAFLHRDKTLTSIRDGTMSRTTLLALCAVGAKFTSPPESDEMAKAWATEAGNRVTLSTEVSRENIATSLLLTIYTQQAGQFAQSHLWSSIANNQAIALGLHRESAHGNRSFSEGERDRRLFYACYTMNRFICNGTPESIQCPSSRIKLRLPCDGFNYRMDVSVETPYAALEDDDSHIPDWMYKNVGAMGFWVRLVGVRATIKRYFHSVMDSRDPVPQAPGLNQPPQNEESGISPNSMPWAPTSLFATCMAKLASLRGSLPPRFQLARDLLVRRRDSPALGQIVMFYLWWNECHIELCSMVLPGYPQSLDEEILSAAPEGWIGQTRENCLRHAQAITDILVLVNNEMSNHPLTLYDHTIAHVVYLSIRVQLELVIPYLGDDMMRAKLIERFEIMLGFLERTCTYFRPVHLLLKEMRQMLQNCNMSTRVYQENESRPETPPQHWFRRQKSLDSRRIAQTTGIDSANLEAMLLELLPDCTSYSAISWDRQYEVDASYPQVPLQGSGWHNVPATAMEGHNTSTNGNPFIMTGGLNELGMLDTWDRMNSQSEVPRFDPLLPGVVTPPSFAGVSSMSDLHSSRSFSFDPLDP